MAILLRVRQNPNANWIENFSAHGWKVRRSDNGAWVQMTPQNTKVRSADNSSWLNVR